MNKNVLGVALESKACLKSRGATIKGARLSLLCVVFYACAAGEEDDNFFFEVAFEEGE